MTNFDPNKLKDYGLFKKFWETPEGTPDGLAHRGLDEVTPDGAETLAQYAKTHELDGTPSAEGEGKIDAAEKALVKHLLAHDHYGAFFELDARPPLLEKFGIPAAEVSAVPAHKRPKDEGTIEVGKGFSKVAPATLARASIESLPERMMAEYKSRRAEFEGANVPAEERARRTLGLLQSYANALWARGEQGQTEAVGHALLDAFEKLPNAKALGGKDFAGIGFGAAQAMVLGLDPNHFVGKYPNAGPKAETTYLSMNDAMAKAMSFVDQYRVATGREAKAEAFEKKSPLGWMIGEESGHKKAGNLDEQKPFSSSGLNWGVLLFPGDAEVKGLPPKSGFEFPIDCIDAFNNSVVAQPSQGDRLEVQDAEGKKLSVKKVIHKDASGKAESWSAVFTGADGKEVEPSKVLGVIKTKSGKVKGDGKASRHLDMWWWGFCDRNTAQKLYKSKFDVPQLDRDVIKIKAGDKTIEIPKAEAQKLIDADIPDLVTGETYSGFRFNDEPQQIRLKNGETFQGRVKDLALEAGPGASRRAGEDILVLHDAPKRPMLGNVEILEGSSPRFVDVRNLESITDEGDGKVTIKNKEGTYPASITGELKTKVPWAKAETIDGKKVLKQTDEMPIRGGFTIDLENGSSRRVDASEISLIAGETQKDMRLSQLLVWVEQNQGMFATDGSTGIVVSNGMRWVNKIDIEEEAGDHRPAWVGDKKLVGIEGELARQPGDKMLYARALYAYQGPGAEPTSSNFEGWIQVSKSGRIVNEGFLSGQPDFGWSASGPLNWGAQSSFNPYMDPELRLKIFVNGVKDTAKLEAMAEKLGLPADWKSHLTPQD